MELFDPANINPLVLLPAGLLLLALIYIGWLSRRSRAELRAKLDDYEQLEIELRGNLQSEQRQSLSLSMELNKERALAEQKLQHFEQNRKQLKIEFENLANRILDDKAKSFDVNNRNSMEALLKPFRDQVESFQKRVNDVHSESIKGNTQLESEIKKVLEVGLKMGSDAKNLTEALKGDSQKRGSWGETLLEKTLQMSGLLENTHYEKQTSMQDVEGRRKQTDFLIRLPDNKHIVIDSKVSLAAYERAVSADTDEKLQRALEQHANAVKRHIDDLAGKDYTNLIGLRSPSFVLMFMPIEPAYIEALKYEKDLFAYGYDKNIVLVSHTTLIPILTTVANLWSMEHSNREARQLGDRAGEIYNQVCKVAERMEKLGKTLTAAGNQYNDSVKALTGRQGLHGKVDRFNQLSSRVSKTMPELPPMQNDIQQESLRLIAEPIVDEDEELDNLKPESKSSTA